nr:hypothetical protein BaRGS_023886 [Batillaria attramentaria]
MGWTYGRGPGCTENKVGQLVNNAVAGNNYWECTSGCGSAVTVSDISYYCKAANSGEQWEQGEKSFTHTFQGQGPFTIATQFDCSHHIRIPILDPDGDNVRCRLATGNECQSVCDALPGMTLDESTCTLSYDANSPSTYRAGGWYAVALTVEDRPQSTITVGGQTYTPTDTLSSIPVQFLVQTPSSNLACDWRPVFVNDTPAEGQVVVVKAGDTLHLNLYATNAKNPAAT